MATSSSGIYFSGLSSGIDTESIIQKLLQMEQQPIQRMQKQQADIASKQAILLQLKTQVTGLSTAAGALNTETAFNPVGANSSDATVASVSVSATARPGIYNLAVSHLATAHKVASVAQASASQPLGLAAGTFVLNGMGITVGSSDTLTSLAQKINAAGAGVVASIIDGGAGAAYLTLTANSTGAANAIQIADLTGSTALSALGWVAAGDGTIREPIPGGATSAALASATAPLSSVFGTTGVGAKVFNLNGTTFSVNFDTQSLEDMAAAINSAGSGATASVRSVVVGGQTRYKLDIKGLTSQADPGGALKALGVLQQGYANPITQAQDASFSIDGIALHSDTNTVTTAIPGLTVNLLKGNDATPATTTITVSKDVQAIETKVKGFVDAYNALTGFIKQNSTFDATSFATGPLFGDPVAEQVEGQLSTMLFSNVAGLTGNYTNLAAIGMGLDSDGSLTLDTSKLDAALAADPNAVSALFQAVGRGSSDAIKYVSSTGKSVPSGATPYIVSIDQVATQASYTSVTAQTSPSTQLETLTFSGGLIGSTSVSLVLEAGSTLASTIAKINSDGTLKDLVTASNDGGFLKIVSKRFGVAGYFAVASNLAASANNSGVGIGSPGTKVAGVDVQGKINGEDAIGNGQFLLGKEGNAKTAGLQIQYTGIAIGANVGTVSFTKGMGALVNDLAGTWNDAAYGLFTSQDHALQAQSDDLAQRISDLQTLAAQKEQDLRDKFNAMETMMAQLQQQQAQLAAMLGKTTATG